MYTAEQTLALFEKELRKCKVGKTGKINRTAFYNRFEACVNGLTLNGMDRAEAFKRANEVAAKFPH